MVGAVKVNAAASRVFEMDATELSAGLRSTVKLVVALPAAYVAVAGVDEVMVVGSEVFDNVFCCRTLY